MAFVDGAPLDAQVLSDLENKISLVSKKVPSLADATVSAPEILAKKSATFDVEVGKLTEKIIPLTLDNGVRHFSREPIVVVSVLSPKGGLTDDQVSVTVGAVSTTSATIYIYYSGDKQTKAGKTKPIAISYIAIAV